MMSGVPILLGLWVHPAMLGWLAAAAAPLIIHLLSRRRYREVQWAAAQFLLAAMRKNARRIRIENWLLLAVRTALIMAVVLAVAEPMLEQSGLVTRTGQPTHKVLVLDASYSMDFKPTDRSRFDRAKQLAEQIVRESKQGDGFTLLLMADPPQMIVATPSFAPAEFLGEIAGLRVTQGGGDLAATLRQVEETLLSARREFPRLTQEQVYFLTDLGRTSWAPDLSATSLAEFQERGRRLGESTALTVVDLGQAGAENLAIDDVRLVDSMVTARQESALVGEVRNFGRQPKPGQKVELYVDGQRTGERTIDVAPGGRATVSFPCRFDAAGEHALELRLAPDQLDVDNHRFLALPVKDQVRVLCVDGRPAGGRFKSATDFLTVALAPPTEQLYRARVRPEVVSERALLDVDLTQFECIFLCNVPQFTQREAQVLRSYLNFGGGLVFFLGDSVLPDSYNRQLAAPSGDARRVLPASLVRAVEEPHYGLDPRGYRHPLAAVFRDSEQAGLLTTPVHKYFKLRLPEAGRAEVALAFDNGDPFIVDEAIGRGRSILVATSADTSWTAMPMWPSYVPIVQELLMLAIRGHVQEHNVTVGQPLGALLPSPPVQGVAVRSPSGEVKQAAVGGDGADRSWTFAETTNSGIFRAQAVGQGSGEAREQTFAVNRNTAEGALAQVAPEELAPEVWPGVHYFHRTNWRDTGDALADQIVVRSRLHLWLLTLALGLLLAESFLNWFMGRHAL